MKIRSTEREHKFTEKLFYRLNLFSIQGLTLDRNRNFTAAVEAIQYEINEVINLEQIFPLIEVKAKYFLAKSLNIPFYYIVFQNKVFEIFEITAEQKFQHVHIYRFNELEFVQWWAKLKGLNQPKPLMEAAERVKNSIFDITLEKHNMAWGGNIDGFMFKNKSFACIIENIYTQKHPLSSHLGEPSYYFNMRGPNYNTWLPTIKLAKQLNIPLFLFTIEGNSEQEKIGFAIIDYLSKKGIYYQTAKPNKNIVKGLDNIEKTILENINAAPPKII